MREKNSSALNILLENCPGDDYTEDRLSYSAADQYHRYKNTKLMNEALERLPRLGDRVEFLKNKGYIPEAAEMLTKHGKNSLLLIADRNPIKEKYSTENIKLPLLFRFISFFNVVNCTKNSLNHIQIKHILYELEK